MTYGVRWSPKRLQRAAQYTTHPPIDKSWWRGVQHSTATIVKLETSCIHVLHASFFVTSSLSLRISCITGTVLCPLESIRLCTHQQQQQNMAEKNKTTIAIVLVYLEAIGIATPRNSADDNDENDDAEVDDDNDDDARW